MRALKVLILGGNAAGMSAASRLVRKAKDVQVTVAERGEEVSYGSCGLPYYVGGFNDDIDLMRMRTAEAFRASGIDLRLHLSAEGVDLTAKQVTLRDHGAKRTVVEGYDKLLIATGSSPILPPIPGVNSKGVYTLKTLADGKALKARLAGANVGEVAIVGGGYIGLELAEACLKLGKGVRIFEAMPALLNGFDAEFGQAAREELEHHGVQVHTQEAVEAVREDEDGLKLQTAAGTYGADVLVFAIGVRPNTAFLPAGAFELLPNGAVVTNRRMETGVPDVYAAGDCGTVIHRLLKKPVYIPLGTGANKQGRLVADVMMGKDAAYDGALGTAMLRCVGLELGKTGLSRAEAEAAGMEVDTVTVQAGSHAPYYPGAVPVTVKLCYQKSSKVVLGAQVMGHGESAWRIDVLAAAVDQGMTARQLGMLDLGYAPPFSSVWDAVQIAANAVK